MKRIHFLGIGGSGASAVAAIAQAQGFEISGCDLNPINEFTQGFEKGILLEGHNPSHLEDINILAVTPAIYSLDPNNPELEAAKKKGIEVLTWQEFMGKYLEKEKYMIAVCGTHGKSTTTAMIGLILEEAGLDPTVELGAVVPKWGKNYRVGGGKYFVTEADEFNDNFLNTTPDISVVTNVEYDHPEYFLNFESYKNSYKKFLEKTEGKIVANLSDGGVRSVILGIHPQMGTPESNQTRFWTSQNDHNIEIIDYSKHNIDFPLQIPGEFNKFNASAAYQVGLSLGIDKEIIKRSLESFEGIGRRFELLGKFKGAKVYSDFGHHPTEIKVNLEALRQKFPNSEIVVIFQPHMFSRTKALFNNFVKVFQESLVDKVYILDIYQSREVDTGEVSSKQLVEAINNPKVTYFTPAENIVEKIKNEVKENQILFFLGAGDSDKWAREILK